MKFIHHAAYKICHQGAHLYHWQPKHASHPVLFCSKASYFQSDKAIRGGIPICWPWFGPKQNSSQHGFARISNWELIESLYAAEGDTYVFRLVTDGSESIDLFPYDAEVLYTICVSDVLTCELKTTNKGSKAFQITAALHNYFEVSDITSIFIDSLSDKKYIDKVKTDANEVTQYDTIYFEKETDRIYLEANSAVLHDPDLNRLIQINSNNGTDIVVWNPWKEKAMHMYDLQDDEYRKFVCIETGCISNPILVQPSQSQILDQIISVF